MDENNDVLEYSDIHLVEEQNNINIEETIEVIDVFDTTTYTVDSDVAFPALGESNEYLKHQLLNGKELPDQHPITAITGLRNELDTIESLQTVYSDKKQLADYYEWEDGNVTIEDRVGYFVSIRGDLRTIKICNTEDIFGVTVDEAAFIGGQDDIIRDYKYGLVLHSGVVDVRCESDVSVDDYVVSNEYGVAKRTSGHCGCKVIAIKDLNSVTYATVTLGVSDSQVFKLGNKMESLGNRLDDAETNIVAAMNVANEAYNKAVDVVDVSEEAIKSALEALNKSNETAERTNNIELNTSLANELAVQAKAISEAAELSADRIRSEAVAAANNALLEAYKTQDNLNELIGEMTPLSQWEGENGSGIVGFVARANADSATLASLAEWSDGGEGQSIAGTIAKVNQHEAVLDHITSHNGINSSTIAQIEQKADDNNAYITSIVSSVDKYSVGEYSQAYGLTREQAASILKPGYIYIPTEHKDKRSHSEIFVGESEVNEFTPGDYYVWGINGQGKSDWIEHSVGSVWISSAIPANSNGVLKYWYLDSNTPPSGYEAYALYMWEDNQWKKINTLAGNASNRAVSMIRQTTNEIAAEVTDARGDFAGLNARLDADKKAQVAMVANVVQPDGSVNTASIVAAVNDKKSTVSINGDHIVLNGATTNGNGTFSISESGHMTATGGNIGGWTIGTYNITGQSGNYRFSINANPDQTSGDWIYAAVYTKDASGNTKTTWPFFVSKAGILNATGAIISGTITATNGSIGNWSISEKYLKGSFTDNASTVHEFHINTDPDSTNWLMAYVKQSGQDATYPFQVNKNGILTATGANITGTITATGGKIANWTISGNEISSEQNGYRLQLSSTASSGDWLYVKNTNNNTYPFYVSKDGTLNATGAVISGKITATDGKIGGWHIKGTTLTGYSNGDPTNDPYVVFDPVNGLGYAAEKGDSAEFVEWPEVCDLMRDYRSYGSFVPRSSSYQTSIISNYKSNGDGETAANAAIYMQAPNGNIRLKADGTYGYITLNSTNIVLKPQTKGTLSGTWVNTSGSAITSDINKKNTINPLVDNYGVLFDNLEPITYKYNDGTSDRLHTGFIAQQVKGALDIADISTQDFAGLVIDSPDTDDESWYLRYNEFVALNTWQIQKAKARITELEERVAQLESLIKE